MQIKMRYFKHTFLVIAVSACSLSSISAQNMGIEFESLRSDEIEYQHSSIHYRNENIADLSVALNWKQIIVGYESAGFPIDIITSNTERTEDEFSVSVDATFELQQRLKWTPSFIYSEGFSNHTSVWLDEYYKQLWGGRTISGDRYTNPDPNTIGAGMQLRWEYIPANAFLSAGFSILDRTIAPGYEFAVEGEHAGKLVRGLTDLQTINFNLVFENNMNQHWRMVNSVVASDTTVRDVRFTFEHQSFVSIADNWILRSSLAYAREGSDFEANRFNFRLIRELGIKWSVFAGFGYYSDNGEVEQANLATDAAPELESQHWITGIQWSSSDQRKNVSLSLGQYNQTYQSNQLDQRFQKLYSDRDWSLLKLSFSYEF